MDGLEWFSLSLVRFALALSLLVFLFFFTIEKEILKWFFLLLFFPWGNTTTMMMTRMIIRMYDSFSVFLCSFVCLSSSKKNFWCFFFVHFCSCWFFPCMHSFSLSSSLICPFVRLSSQLLASVCRACTNHDPLFNIPLPPPSYSPSFPSTSITFKFTFDKRTLNQLENRICCARSHALTRALALFLANIAIVACCLPPVNISESKKNDDEVEACSNRQNNPQQSLHWMLLLWPERSILMGTNGRKTRSSEDIPGKIKRDYIATYSYSLLSRRNCYKNSACESLHPKTEQAGRWKEEKSRKCLISCFTWKQWGRGRKSAVIFVFQTFMHTLSLSLSTNEKQASIQEPGQASIIYVSSYRIQQQKSLEIFEKCSTFFLRFSSRLTNKKKLSMFPTHRHKVWLYFCFALTCGEASKQEEEYKLRRRENKRRGIKQKIFHVRIHYHGFL